MKQFKFTIYPKENGRNIRALRTEHMCSRPDVCRAANMAVSGLQFIENGQYSATIITMVKILDALGYDLIAVPRPQDDE